MCTLYKKNNQPPLSCERTTRVDWTCARCSYVSTLLPHNRATPSVKGDKRIYRTISVFSHKDIHSATFPTATNNNSNAEAECAGVRKLGAVACDVTTTMPVVVVRTS